MSKPKLVTLSAAPGAIGVTVGSNDHDRIIEIRVIAELAYSASVWLSPNEALELADALREESERLKVLG